MNLPIGDLSRRTEVKVPTIRYYEQIGLLPPPARTEGKQRRYGASEVKRLNFIRHARELGFDIEDIRQLLTLSEEPQESCHQVDSIARQHLDEIDLRIGQARSPAGRATAYGRRVRSRPGLRVSDHRSDRRPHPV